MLHQRIRFFQTDTEAAAALRLRTALEPALAAQAPLPPLWPAIAGAYWPLEKLADAQSFLKRQWPPAVETLIAQQVKEPARERELASTIPALTELDDEVSRRVRQQYEESPYPRWIKASPVGQTTIEAHLRQLFPLTNIHNVVKTSDAEILIALDPEHHHSTDDYIAKLRRELPRPRAPLLPVLAGR